MSGLRTRSALWLLWGLAAPLSVTAAPLTVEAPTEVRGTLERHLDLARALVRAGAAPLDADERQRLCGITPQQVRGLLETLGHFNPQAIELDCEAGRLRVGPGPTATVRSLNLRLAEPEANAPANAEAETDRKPLSAWQAMLPLTVGQAFNQDVWAGAKRGLLAQARAQGHPLARWRASEARVEAEANAVDVTLELDPGPAVRLGAIEIEGLVHHNDARTLALLGLQEGQPYTEQRLLNAQERLLKAGLFDTVQVELDPERLTGNRMPVRVRVKETPLQQLSLGVGWQSNSGERATFEHIDRKAFGRALRSRTKLTLGREAQAAELELSTHPEARQRRELLALHWQRELNVEAPFQQVAVRLGQVFETRSEDRAVTLEGLSSRQGEATAARRAQAVLVHLNPTWRALDSVILPTRGNAWVLQSALGYSRSQDALGERRSGPLLRLHGRWQHFSTFEGGRGLNWRVEAGQLWSRDELGVPESLRWRAGGDESVRGYTYRSLGPSNLGEDVGGSVVWTASAEATQPLPRDWVAGLDGLSVAAFIDAGQAGQGWRDVRKPALGAGLGLRWRSPVGLLRADVARGEPAKGGGWRLHIAVGLAL